MFLLGAANRVNRSDDVHNVQIIPLCSAQLSYHRPQMDVCYKNTKNILLQLGCISFMLTIHQEVSIQKNYFCSLYHNSKNKEFTI